MKSLLITGFSNIVESSLLKKINKKKYAISVLLTEEENQKFNRKYDKKFEKIIIDFDNIQGFKELLQTHSWDIIVHVGTPKKSNNCIKKKYFNVNFKEQLIINALKNKSKILYCSSVDVFGTIPLELPANNETEKVEGKCIRSNFSLTEKIFFKYLMNGLDAYIIRASLLYGKNVEGFSSFLLKKIINKNLYLPNKKHWIHLLNIETLIDALVMIIDNDYSNNRIFLLADKDPILLRDLVNFIYKSIHKKDFPQNRIIWKKYFFIAEKICSFMKWNDKKRLIQLLNNSWFYESDFSCERLFLKKKNTIPSFQEVLNEYN